MQTPRLSLLAAGGLTLFLGGGLPAQGATVTDHFNDYGAVSGGLPGMSGSETGWAGPWLNSANLVNTPDYFAGEQLSYAATGYSNLPNQSGADDGAAGDDPNATAGQIVTRALETPMTGTIWFSALVRSASDTGDALVWFNKVGNATNNFIAIRNGAGVLRFSGSDSIGGTYAAGTTHLLLARIDVNDSGPNDTIDFYINPDLSGGEAGLGAPLFSAAGADAFGSSINDIAISFEETGDRLDAIRISNDANAFAQVTMVPEPASLGLLALAGVATLRRRRQ